MNHVQMVITLLVHICQSSGGVILCPSDHLRTDITGEELMDKSDNTLVDIEVIKLVSVVLFGGFTGRTPVPQFCTETVQKKVNGQSDVLFGVDVRDESLVCSEKKENMDQDGLVAAVVFVLEV